MREIVPIITHLFFADDNLIMGNTNVISCDNIREVLSIYPTELLGKKLIFSPNMSEIQKSEVFAALNMLPNESLDVYLGLPAFIGRNKTQIFDTITMRV